MARIFLLLLLGELLVFGACTSPVSPAAPTETLQTVARPTGSPQVPSITGTPFSAPTAPRPEPQITGTPAPARTTPKPQPQLTVTPVTSPVLTPSPTPPRLTPSISPSPTVEVSLSPATEVILRNLEVPWSLAFDPGGRLFFTERGGRVRLWERGRLQTEPVAFLPVAAVGEGGLLGLALAPDFGQTHFIYVYYTYRNTSGGLSNRVVRLVEQNGKGLDAVTVLDGIPGASIHDGGRLRFGPDGKLYVTTGDAANAPQAQDLRSLAGKILRLNPDGSVPADNPFRGSPIYSYGHRNPQGLDWHPVTGVLFATEHGQTAHDEVNIIQPGGNYGWPQVSGEQTGENFIPPLLQTGNNTWAPSGTSFYRGNLLSPWKGNLFIAHTPLQYYISIIHPSLFKPYPHQHFNQKDGFSREKLFVNYW